MSVANDTTISAKETRLGFITAIAAYAWWGVLPIYLRSVGFADPMEVLAQRILWAIPAAFATVLVLNGGLRKGLVDIFAALTPRRFGALVLSAIFIFFNWGIYVWAVAHERIADASLAYFLTPLVQTAFGVAFFQERMNTAQKIALALAGLGVVVQGIALGAVPVISLALCLTWSLYGLVRKQVQVSSSSGLLIESTLLAPLAIALLVWISHGPGITFDDSVANAGLLILAGPFTAIPLILFAFGARRLSFVALAPLQYATPSFQFLLAIYFGETVTPLRLASFAFIWLGLAVATWDIVARERARRKLEAA
jgi:chloramphenicol-sensitive protein RarD